MSFNLPPTETLDQILTPAEMTLLRIVRDLEYEERLIVATNWTLGSSLRDEVILELGFEWEERYIGICGCESLVPIMKSESFSTARDNIENRVCAALAQSGILEVDEQFPPLIYSPELQIEIISGPWSKAIHLLRESIADKLVNQTFPRPVREDFSNSEEYMATYFNWTDVRDKVIQKLLLE